VLLSSVQVLDVSCVLQVRAGLHRRILLGVIMCIIVLLRRDSTAVIAAVVPVAIVALRAAWVVLCALPRQ